MSYRDELEAAQHRIVELEDELREAKAETAEKAETASPEPPPPSEPSPPPRRRSGASFLGIPLGVVLLAGSCAVGQPLCGRIFGAATGGTAPAMKALRACPKALEALGDDVDWAAYGCANCESQGGGDPLNGGCHSSFDWQMPVAGARGRGSYSWSFSQPAGQPERFTGGHVVLSSGVSVSITPNGCP